MTFTIVADRQGILTFSRCTKPHEALLLASSRVQDGAEGEWVYDEAWQFVCATALAVAAHQQG